MSKKTKIGVMLFMVFISMIEVYFIYRIRIEYEGIYQIGFFLVLFIAQPFLFGMIIKNKKSPKIEIFFVIVTFIVLPIIIYFTLPNYTYLQGKEMIEQEFQDQTQFIFLDNDYGQYTVPVIENSEQIFIANRVYYYTIRLNNETKYMIIDPLTGELKEMEEKYW